jgi:hypothetical protein
MSDDGIDTGPLGLAAVQEASSALVAGHQELDILEAVASLSFAEYHVRLLPLFGRNGLHDDLLEELFESSLDLFSAQFFKVAHVLILLSIAYLLSICRGVTEGRFM